jgi:YHS domain-containing protein
MNHCIVRPLLSVALLLVMLPAVAQDDLNPYFNVDGKGLWVEGYDPVAYLLEGKAREGDRRYSTTYNGATFRFTGPAHLDLFKKDPTKYLPQYGGWCAYAMGANNEKVEVDPQTFKIIGGRLFLFYNAFFNNTLSTWNKDEVRLHQAAERNWAAFEHAK